MKFLLVVFFVGISSVARATDSGPISGDPTTPIKNVVAFLQNVSISRIREIGKQDQQRIANADKELLALFDSGIHSDSESKATDIVKELAHTISTDWQGLVGTLMKFVDLYEQKLSLVPAIVPVAAINSFKTTFDSIVTGTIQQLDLSVKQFSNDLPTIYAKGIAAIIDENKKLIASGNQNNYIADINQLFKMTQKQVEDRFSKLAAEFAKELQPELAMATAISVQLDKVITEPIGSVTSGAHNLITFVLNTLTGLINELL